MRRGHGVLLHVLGHVDAHHGAARRRTGTRRAPGRARSCRRRWARGRGTSRWAGSGRARPARERRTAFDTAMMASSWPTTRWLQALLHLERASGPRPRASCGRGCPSTWRRPPRCPRCVDLFLQHALPCSAPPRGVAVLGLELLLELRQSCRSASSAACCRSPLALGRSAWRAERLDPLLDPAEISLDGRLFRCHCGLQRVALLLELGELLLDLARAARATPRPVSCATASRSIWSCMMRRCDLVDLGRAWSRSRCAAARRPRR